MAQRDNSRKQLRGVLSYTKEPIGRFNTLILIILCLLLSIYSGSVGYKVGETQGHNKAVNECQKEIMEDIPIGLSSILLSCTETFKLYAECKVDLIKEVRDGKASRL